MRALKRWLSLVFVLCLAVPTMGAVTSTTTSVGYTGTGTATVYAVPFKFFLSSDLVVKVTPSGGATATMNLGSDYTVTGAGFDSGGTVTFTTAPASNAAVSITRVTPVTQPTSFAAQGSFSPKTHEAALDRAMMAVQESIAANNSLAARIGAVETTQSTLGQSTLTTLPAFVSVKAYGAKGDAVTDDTVSIRNAVAAAQALGGGTVFFPNTGKAYRVTAQIVVGVRYVTEGDVVPTAGSWPNLPSYNATNATAAITQPAIDLIGEPGATLWGDFAPSIDTAIIYYGIRNGNQISPYTATIKNLNFLAQPAMTSGGTFTNIAGASPITAVHQLGVFAAGMTLNMQDLTFRDFGRALVTSDSYWATYSRIFVFRAIDGVTINSANAARLEHSLVSYAQGYAFVTSGQGVSLNSIYSEQCAMDLFIPSGDNVHVTHTYLENTSSSQLDYAIKLGVAAWKANTNYTVNQHAFNGANKYRVQSITGSGTSAASGGPTCTSGTCVDNQVTWQYVGYPYRTTSTAYVIGQWVVNGAYAYQVSVAGTTGTGAGPTGTGNGQVDGTVTWNYAATLVNAGQTQVTYASLTDIHSSKAGGKHMQIAGTSAQMLNSRFYTTSSASKTWLDDTGSSLRLIYATTAIDQTSPGAAGVSVVDENTFQNQGGLYIGSSAYNGITDGSHTTGIQMGTDSIWYDTTNGLLRWKHTVPANISDGQSLIPTTTITGGYTPGAIAAGTSYAINYSLAGANVNDPIVVQEASGTILDGLIIFGHVSAAGNVKIILSNVTAASITPGTLTFRVTNWHLF